jgi:hypothetical protein
MRFDWHVACVFLGTAFFSLEAHPSLAQVADSKVTPQRAASGEGGKVGKKMAEQIEAEKVLDGPAARSECLWLGKRVISLLWRDDLDTAFRHLDLYDRFGCSAEHIQIVFRCVLRQGSFDTKAAELLNGRIQSCWLNPSTDPVIAPSISAAGAVRRKAQ